LPVIFAIPAKCVQYVNLIIKAQLTLKLKYKCCPVQPVHELFIRVQSLFINFGPDSVICSIDALIPIVMTDLQ